MPTINKMPKKKPDYTKRGNNILAAKIYNTPAWKNVRKAKLQANPICEMCLDKGIIKPTEEIHHIKPILSGKDELEMYELAYDFTNLISLCKSCHHQVHKDYNKNS